MLIKTETVTQSYNVDVWVQVGGVWHERPRRSKIEI